MTGDAAILALKYAEGSTGPETIVLKYAKDLEANRVLAQEANMYEKETFFYRELHRSAAAAAAAGSARTSAPNAARWPASWSRFCPCRASSTCSSTPRSRRSSSASRWRTSTPPASRPATRSSAWHQT